MEVCGYCGERRGEKLGCCGENHWDEVDDEPGPCECRQGECESKSDKVCRMSEEVGRPVKPHRSGGGHWVGKLP